jgi:hypothetical protein
MTAVEWAYGADFGTESMIWGVFSVIIVGAPVASPDVVWLLKQ